jgi:hypothetical protein
MLHCINKVEMKSAQMSISHKTPKSDYDPIRIDEIIKAAKRERNEAIGQLFGFGFTAVKDAVGGLARKDPEHVRGPVAGVKG